MGRCTHGLTTLAILLAIVTPLVGGSTDAAQRVMAPRHGFLVQPEGTQPAQEIGHGYFEVSLLPGQTQPISVAVQNTGQDRLQVRTYAVDAVPIVGGGGIDFSTRGTLLSGVGRWLQLSRGGLTVAPGVAARVVALVHVPTTTPAGDYVAGVAVEDTRGQTMRVARGISIDAHYRRVLAVVVSVPGPRHLRVQVTSATLTRSSGPTQVTVLVHNSGNVLARGSGTVEVTGLHAITRPLTVTMGTLLPGAQGQLQLDLPHVHLPGGSYLVRVTLRSDTQSLLATWQGHVVLSPAAISSPTALPVVPLRLDTLRPAVVVVGAGTALVLGGSGFDALATVSIGDTDVANVQIVGTHSLRVRVPATLAAGTYDVRVTEADVRVATLVGALSVRPHLTLTAHALHGQAPRSGTLIVFAHTLPDAVLSAQVILSGHGLPVSALTVQRGTPGQWRIVAHLSTTAPLGAGQVTLTASWGQQQVHTTVPVRVIAAAPAASRH